MLEKTVGVGLIVAVILLCVVAPIVSLVGIPIEYSTGERTGVVVKLSKKGVVWKTWEGQMNLGAMSTDGGGMVVPDVFMFSVQDDAVAQQIQELSRRGGRATLHYYQPWVMSAMVGSSGYLITRVETQ